MKKSDNKVVNLFEESNKGIQKTVITETMKMKRGSKYFWFILSLINIFLYNRSPNKKAIINKDSCSHGVTTLNYFAPLRYSLQIFCEK